MKENISQPSIYHKTVLPLEVIDQLALKPHGTYLDVTFGGGGHTRRILEAEPTCTVIAFDWDKIALERNGEPLKACFGERLKLVWGNFAHLERLLKKEKVKAVDGILADFGTSQFQIHEREGFSFRKDSVLDMRMSPGHQKIWARDLLMKLPEKEIARILFEYGEEFAAAKIARAVVQNRQKKRILTTFDLVAIVEQIIPNHKGRKVHPATKTFQALRIAVNNEFENITSFLKTGVRHLKPGGRFVCISFHSLEDRLVKNFFREQKESLTIITKKPLTASETELHENASSRSAKLRTAEKIALNT